LAFKIADMGVSRDLTTLSKNSHAVYHRGTPRYMAPEQNQEKPNQKLDFFKVEVFSLGVILGKLIFKAFIFSSDSQLMDKELSDP